MQRACDQLLAVPDSPEIITGEVGLHQSRSTR